MKREIDFLSFLLLLKFSCPLFVRADFPYKLDCLKRWCKLLRMKIYRHFQYIFYFSREFRRWLPSGRRIWIEVVWVNIITENGKSFFILIARVKIVDGVTQESLYIVRGLVCWCWELSTREINGERMLSVAGVRVGKEVFVAGDFTILCWIKAQFDSIPSSPTLIIASADCWKTPFN